MPRNMERDANYYHSLSSFLFFLAVNRGCRSGMYCSSNDRSKNRVKYQGSEIINNFSLSLSQPFYIVLSGGIFNPRKKGAHLQLWKSNILFVYFSWGFVDVSEQGHPSLIPGNCAHAAMRWQIGWWLQQNRRMPVWTRTCICCRTGYIFRHLR